MTRLRALGLLTVALLATGGAWAQTEAEEIGGLAEDQDRARIESADLLRYDPVEGTYHLTGHVVFSHRDIKLYCDEAVYDYDENSAVAKGNPRIVSKDTTITGTLVEVDFDNEVAGIRQRDHDHRASVRMTMARPEQARARSHATEGVLEADHDNLREDRL